jgi:copper chaperone CopZ
VEGAKAVSVDFSSSTATVSYQKGRPTEPLVDAIKKAGYPQAKVMR